MHSVTGGAAAPPPRGVLRYGGAWDVASEEESILWHLLEHEKYSGSTKSSSPERTINRSLFGAPQEYEAIAKPGGASPRRRVAWQKVESSPTAPSPQYNYPDWIASIPPPRPRASAPPTPPERTVRSMAEEKLRQQFSTHLGDIERDWWSKSRLSSTHIYGWQPASATSASAPAREPLSSSFSSGAAPSAAASSGATAAAPSASMAAAPSASTAEASGPPAPAVEGPWLPRWQPAPSRRAVSEATDRLYGLEGDLHFARVATGRAVRIWVYAEDRRPMVRKLRAAARHWTLRALGGAWVRWRAEATALRRLRTPVSYHLARKRAAAVRGAWLAWRLEILRWKRGWLGDAFAKRLQSDAAHAFWHWKATLAGERAELERALQLSLIFRRWALLRETQMMTRLMLRDALVSMDAELSGAGVDGGGMRAERVAAAARGVVRADGGPQPSASGFSMSSHMAGAGAGASGFSSVLGPPRRAHFATPLTGR